MAAPKDNVAEAEALTRKIVAAIDADARKIVEHQMAQQEAFLARHLDLHETHTLCEYPERQEYRDDYHTLAHKKLIALVPKDRIEQGFATPEKYAREHFPCATIVWETMGRLEKR
jgi:hypothetical protein